MKNFYGGLRGNNAFLDKQAGYYPAEVARLLLQGQVPGQGVRPSQAPPLDAGVRIPDRSKAQRPAHQEAERIDVDGTVSPVWAKARTKATWGAGRDTHPLCMYGIAYETYTSTWEDTEAGEHRRLSRGGAEMCKRLHSCLASHQEQVVQRDVRREGGVQLSVLPSQGDRRGRGRKRQSRTSGVRGKRKGLRVLQ